MRRGEFAALPFLLEHCGRNGANFVRTLSHKLHHPGQSLKDLWPSLDGIETIWVALALGLHEDFLFEHFLNTCLLDDEATAIVVLERLVSLERYRLLETFDLIVPADIPALPESTIPPSLNLATVISQTQSDERHRTAPFPASWEDLRDLVEKKTKAVALVKTTLGPTTLRQSKFGGLPYLPRDSIHFGPLAPTMREGIASPQLTLLAQINCAELPTMRDFPERGILQFFVDCERWHELQDSLHVLFHRDVHDDHASFLAEHDPQLQRFRSPRVSEQAISFDATKDYRSPADHRFETDYDFSPYDRSQPHPIRDYLDLWSHRRFRFPTDDVGYGMNKLNGYHYSQNDRDPRPRTPEWNDSVLLLQLGDYDELSWGDCGEAKFFIQRKDLRQRDFSRVLFHWDST